jgi:hypothetical protein
LLNFYGLIIDYYNYFWHKACQFVSNFSVYEISDTDSFYVYDAIGQFFTGYAGG